MTDQTNYIEFEALQEFNHFQTLVNTREFITKDEYDFIIAYDATEKNNFFYIGDYSKQGDYLNLNVYSEHDHEKRQYEMEVGI
jgi:hypothetical protein